MIGRRNVLASILASALLAGCGGTGGLPTTGGTSGGTSPLALTLHVPGSSTALRSGRRVPLYTSRDTKGIGVEYQASAGGYTGAPLASGAGLSYGQSIAPGASGCDAVAAANGSFNCTVYIPGVPVGYDDLRIALWNAAPTGCTTGGSGCSFLATGDKVLSFADLTNYAIVSGLSNALSFTLLPVVDSVSANVSPGIVNTVASNPKAYLTIKDAAGDIILGTDQLIDASGNALTITLDIANDLPGACTTFGVTPSCSINFGANSTQPSYTTAGGGNSVTLTYDGTQTFPTTGVSEPAISIGVSGGTISGTNQSGNFTVCTSAPCVALPGGTQ